MFIYSFSPDDQCIGYTAFRLKTASSVKDCSFLDLFLVTIFVSFFLFLFVINR